MSRAGFPELPASVRARTVPQLMAEAVAAAPERVALIGRSRIEGGELHLTFADLAQRARRLAAALQDRGIAKGDRVGIMFDNAGFIEAQIAYHAVHHLGAIAFPINTRYVERELRPVLAFTDPRAIIFDARFADLLAKSLADAEAVILVASHGGTGAAELFDRLLNAGADDRPAADVCEADDADWIFTSGTTGKAKAAAFSHAQAVACAYQAIPVWGLDETSRFHGFAPVFTSTGIHTCPLPCLAAKCTYIVQHDVDYDDLLLRIRDYGSTTVFIFTVMLALLFERSDRRMLEELELRSVRRICYGGQTMPRSFHKKMHELFCEQRGIDLVTLYGLTEAGPAGLYTEAHDHAELLRRHGHFGIPIGRIGFNEWVEHRIVTQSGAAAQPDEIGELQMRAPSVMSRYVGDEQATAQILADGWLHTGDLVTRDADGYVYFVDRAKLMIRRGSMNISSAEVEGVVLDHPDVVEVAAMPRPNPVLGEDVHLFVVPRAGQDVSQETIIEFCRGKLADYKIPASVSFIDALPRNAMGRIVRAELKSLVSALP